MIFKKHEKKTLKKFLRGGCLHKTVSENHVEFEKYFFKCTNFRVLAESNALLINGRETFFLCPIGCSCQKDAVWCNLLARKCKLIGSTHVPSQTFTFEWTLDRI